MVFHPPSTIHHPPTEDPISTDEMSDTDADWAVNISLENLKTKINDTCWQPINSAYASAHIRDLESICLKP